MKNKSSSNDGSLLAKVFGIYEATFRNKTYKFVVMQNIFFGLEGQLKVYDLKGSEVNRLAMPYGDKSFTGLDTNFIIDK
jgi:1-phosphatidylinositol-3-phosphate 5-kinase